ncbi:MAG: aminotransferase class I/II-fold pyridoxal phosphate-dependent enzyme [Clostridium argentinense]|uniref:Aminotransferase n=1 Tax=Clostridium faecium TaxID=2762223 RepID=A0ABR8YXF3_9CLOT|nr:MULTISPECIES: aminotransferase class I/II-fold pyridoxal phosphate-dependent enzyme [Clostridium]MBD8048519.1 aminotransferase class I/II-fold pyridoxal phosphate-dependent enzyme [Clostridium faecium]MBS5824859.1 aminotransferase class I/II-fold pyridoxal phosphate-dependent enzyme [Clostridium argentinense]MDU1347881.1 aminotransferase class I/II-fold pyridoxal phosphate-dependent enzyme [Clostridium argentinense]
MNNIFSKNVESIEISGIRKFFNQVSKIPDAISLTLGQPDFYAPKAIKDGVIKAINENKTVYTSNAGILELREEICSFLKKFQVYYNAEEICITVGGSEGLMCVFTTLLNNGDKVLIPKIAYPAYESLVKMLGGQVVNYPLKEDFSVDFDKLRELIITEKPKVLVISYPNNPTGSILSKKERDEFYKIIKENNIVAVSDEIYSSLCYDEYYSICQYEDIKDKLILVSGFSKMFSMTGLRVGYVASSEYIMKNIIKVHQYNVSSATSVSQYAALEGLKNSLDDVVYMKDQFEKRKDYVYSRLKDMGLKVHMPKGAFYIFPSIKEFNMSSEEFCTKLLKEEKVAIVPGSAFGEGGEGYIRISYCYKKDELKEALDRMEKFITKYR